MQHQLQQGASAGTNAQANMPRSPSARAGTLVRHRPAHLLLDLEPLRSLPMVHLEEQLVNGCLAEAVAGRAGGMLQPVSCQGWSQAHACCLQPAHLARAAWHTSVSGPPVEQCCLGCA